MTRAFLPFGGLLKRELIRDLRRPRPVVLLVGVLGFASMTVISGYPYDWISSLEMRTRSMQILAGLSGTLFTAAILLLPGYAATAIVVERESDTYDLLSLTLTRPSTIVLGKLASSLGYFLLIELATLPLLGTTMFMVGVDTATIALSAIFLTIVAVTCTSMGIMASALARTTPRAVMLAYMSTFIALAGYLVPLGLILALAQMWRLTEIIPIAERVIEFAASLSPFGAMGMAFGVTSYSSSNALLRLALGQGAFSLLALLVARRLLVQRTADRGCVPQAVRPPLPSSPSIPTPLINTGQALPPWPPVRDGANPMLAREVLQVRLVQRMSRLRAVLLAVGILLIMMMLYFSLFETGMPIGPRDAHIVVLAWMIGMAVLMAFVAPGTIASGWSREYERETIDLLRMSLLTPRQLVSGKVGAALRACVMPMLLGGIASLPLFPYAVASSHALVFFAAGLVTVAVTALECVAVATFMGLLARRTATCVLYGYAGSMAAMCAPFLLNLAILIATFFRGPDSFYVPSWHLSPITVYAYRFYSGGRLDTVDIVIWAICVVLQTAFALVLLRTSVAILSAYHLRDR